MIINRAKVERMQRDINASKTQIALLRTQIETHQEYKPLDMINEVEKLRAELANTKNTLAITYDEAEKGEAENRTLAEAVETLSSKLAARRAISKQRLGAIKNRDKVHGALRENLDAHAEANGRLRKTITKQTHTLFAQDERIEKLLYEVKGAHSTADMWLDQVHQRDRHITVDVKKISELKKRIEQRDEEMRLLLCDVYPDGRIRGTTAAENQMTQAQRELNRFAQSKLRGLQHKNQEIGSQLGYYKQQTEKLQAENAYLRRKQQIQVVTIKKNREDNSSLISVINEAIQQDTKLRKREQIQIDTIKRQRGNLAAAHNEISRLLKVVSVWKRKYHQFALRWQPLLSRPLDLADPTVGRNADD